MRRMLFLSSILIFSIHSYAQFLVPIEVNDRSSVSEIRLTDIGEFGIVRKERPSVPSHYHTGIDIKRPGKDYENPVYIYPIAPGKVISKRTDGPFAQLIIEHELEVKFWTVYEHIGGIQAEPGQSVHPLRPIARFYTSEELDAYGWQFDHFHFEILKIKPIPISPDTKTPERYFNSYTLICDTPEKLEKYFFDPMKFMNERL